MANDISEPLTNNEQGTGSTTEVVASPESKPLSPEELERKKKKEEKAKEKNLKKLKAAQKAAKLKAEAEAEAAKRKEEAEASARQTQQASEPTNDIGRDDNIDKADGAKKNMSTEMAKAYDPICVEKSWYEWWEKSGFFIADKNSPKPPYAIIFPPPNVTGSLHLGHGLPGFIQDALARWRRMSGDNVLWVPGMDHAGIATQVVVEKKLMRESNKSRHDFSRQEFINEVWNWKEQKGEAILKQLRRLGVSLDWSREFFTMDEKRSTAVTEAFVRLYDEGLIYRDIRLVNWDCALRTAISDVEVEHKDFEGSTKVPVPNHLNHVEFGVLTHFTYRLENGEGKITVATTRPETMLGDTAIAVHPDDEKYKKFHGKYAIHPFNGRRLPIICDSFVDMNFGTGAVKITPAHDHDDFAVGKRHNLEFINIFSDDGKINSNGGPQFEGKSRFDARVDVIKALDKEELFHGSKPNKMSVGFSMRSGDVIEPLIKPQWYVRCEDVANEALGAVMDKNIEIIPKQYAAEWKRWLDNIHDWCISRQLWWGHQIPAWYVSLDEEKEKGIGSSEKRWVVARNESEAREKASKSFPGKKIHLTRDPDVLDTWFSSALLPLSALGWPDNTEELDLFYPTSVLETGHDILFFWVARMVMLCMKLHGEVPFKKIYLHPMIRDAHGRKMSKSLGNVIDPLDVIKGIKLNDLLKKLEEGNLDPKELKTATEGQKKDFPEGIPTCGADALRFSLISYTAQSDKINLDIKRVFGYREWCNKLWNAVRFALGIFGDDYTPPAGALAVGDLPFSCQWILSVLNKTISKTVSSLESFEFSDATTAVYSWWRFQLCDVFIELTKPHQSNKYVQDTLWVCLETGLRLLHPFMPFITEELWQRLPGATDKSQKESIMLCDYPTTVEGWSNDGIEAEMSLVDSVVKILRSLMVKKEKSNDDSRIEPKFVRCRNDQVRSIIEGRRPEISTLSMSPSLKKHLKETDPSYHIQILEKDAQSRHGYVVDVVNEDVSVYVKNYQGNQFAQTVLENLIKRLEEVKSQKDSLLRTTSATGYMEKVDANIVKENGVKLDTLGQQLCVFEEAIKHLEREIGWG